MRNREKKKKRHDRDWKGEKIRREKMETGDGSKKKKKEERKGAENGKTNIRRIKG